MRRTPSASIIYFSKELAAKEHIDRRERGTKDLGRREMEFRENRKRSQVQLGNEGAIFLGTFSFAFLVFFCGKISVNPAIVSRSNPTVFFPARQDRASSSSRRRAGVHRLRTPGKSA